jgi:glycine cleavage system regulatory protein
MNSQHFILTLSGQDRPGLVERVAGVVAAHGGNWLESRLIHLGGYFAGVVRVEIPAGAYGAVQQGLSALSAEGLTVQAVPAAAGAGAAAVQVAVEITGLDHPGIVSQIASAVARAGLNVEEFSSEVVSAPMSGEPLFTASMRLTGPEGVSLEDLSAALERLSSELMVEISLQPQPA